MSFEETKLHIKEVVGGGWSNEACSVPQSCPTLCSPIDYSLPGSYVHGISQARILEWLPLPTPSNLPDPGIKPTSLQFLALAGGFFTTSTLESLLIKCVIKERGREKKDNFKQFVDFFFFPGYTMSSHFKWSITIWGFFFFNMRFCFCLFLFDVSFRPRYRKERDTTEQLYLTNTILAAQDRKVKETVLIPRILTDHLVYVRISLYPNKVVLKKSK